MRGTREADECLTRALFSMVVMAYSLLYCPLAEGASKSLSRPSTFWYSACLSLATSAFAALGGVDKVLVDDVHLRYPSNAGSKCRRQCTRTVMTQYSMRVLRAASRKVARKHASSSEFSSGGSSENERHGQEQSTSYRRDTRVAQRRVHVACNP
jgi:hypothetical protein